jgi:hypothetical protein
MTTRAQCGVTAGLAIVGASVLAVAPLTLPTPPSAAPVQLGGAARRRYSARAGAALVEGLGESGIRTATAAALTPLSPVLAGTALAFGDNNRAYSVIRQSIDAPLWAADPAIQALADVLPEGIGGGDGDNKGNQPEDGALIQFRDNVLWAATNAVRTPIRDALGADDSLTDRNFASELGQGLGESGLRAAEGAVLAPLGLIPIAQAIASGDETDLYLAIRQYVDGPLWAADPAIEGLTNALPKPLGGGSPDNQGNQQDDGAIVQFRDNVLWKATYNVREPIREALGVAPGTGDATARVAVADSDGKALDNGQVLNLTTTGRSGSSAKETVAASGGGPGNAAASGSATTSPRPISTTLKTIDKNFSETANKLDQSVKKFTGADKTDTAKADDAS